MHEIANSFKGGTMISFCDGYPETQEEAENIKAKSKAEHNLLRMLERLSSLSVIAKIKLQ
jgi:hypothetical protein